LAGRQDRLLKILLAGDSRLDIGGTGGFGRKIPDAEENQKDDDCPDDFLFSEEFLDAHKRGKIKLISFFNYIV
jgi:hypothetical protein